jgi:AraC-like DNA-binding protein
MLRYLGFGMRELGNFPMPPHKRVNWEFLAVVAGKAAPYFQAGHRPAPVRATIWLFPPGFVHGWLGEASKKCEVFVAHFNSVPQVVEQLVNESGPLSVSLRGPDIRRIRRFTAELQDHYWNPNFLSDIYTERVLMDLSLLITRDTDKVRVAQPIGKNLPRILKAEAWFREHMASQPSVRRVASAVGLSPSHLARLFRLVRKDRAKRVFNKLRIEKAMDLLGHSDAKLHSVAEDCGFSTASNFCRAFKVFVGNSPTMWRKEMFIEYRKPRSSEFMDHMSHGRRKREI